MVRNNKLGPERCLWFQALLRMQLEGTVDRMTGPDSRPRFLRPAIFDDGRPDWASYGKFHGEWFQSMAELDSDVMTLQPWLVEP